MSVLDNRPILKPLKKRDWWQLVEDYSLIGYHVPAGFKCDLDSIPRAPLIHAILKGRTRVGALIHDWLYVSGEEDRYVADNVLLEIMELEGVNKIYRYSIYWAVRLGGWYRWNQLRRGVDVRRSFE